MRKSKGGASEGDPEEIQEESERVEKLRVMKVVESEEMQSLINDDPEIAAEEVRILGRLRKIAQVTS